MKFDIKKTTDNVNKFYRSKYSFISFTLIFAVVAGLQYLAFGLGVEKYILSLDVISESHDGIIKIGSEWAWIGWLTITTTSLASWLTVIGIIFVIRQENKFFKYEATATVLALIADVILFLWFDALKWFILVYLYWKRKQAWDKPQGNTAPRFMETKDRWLAGIIILSGGLFFGAAMALADQYSRYIKDAIPYMDALAMAFVVGGVLLLSPKYVEGWGVLVIGDIISVIAFSMIKQWSVVAMAAIFLVSDTLSGMLWYTLAKEDIAKHAKLSNIKVGKSHPHPSHNK